MKIKLRAELAAQRLAITSEDWERRSRTICERIVLSSSWKSWRKVALYQSFRGEVDLSPLPRMSPDKEYYFPKIDAAEGTMEFYKALDATSFQKNSWGLSEPDGRGERLIPDAHTLLIIPALAFDRAGQRLGYGKGFYDRYLSGRTVGTLGVCFAEFLLEALPIEPHDVPVQNIITDLDSI